MAERSTSNNIRKLDVDNYSTWAFQFEHHLKAQDLWEPMMAGIDSKEAARAFSQLNLCVEEHHIPTLMSCKNGKEAWKILEANSKAQLNIRVMQLHNDLHDLEKASGEPMTKYLSRVRNIVLDLKQVGESISDAMVVMSTLRGLPKHYAMVKEILRNREDCTLATIGPTLMSVEADLDSEERREAKAFAARTKFGGGSGAGGAGEGSNPNRGKECYYCHKMGHIKANCRTRKQDEANGTLKEESVKAMCANTFAF